MQTSHSSHFSFTKYKHSPNHTISSYTIFKNLKEKIYVFETSAKLFLAGMKVQWDKDGRRKLLGNNICGRSYFSTLEFGFQLDSLVYTTIVDHMYTQFQVVQNSTHARSSRV
jgi:hypothetical protein